MSRSDLDRVLNSIRDDAPSQETVDRAAARVRSRLGGESAPVTVERLESCADFRALAPVYRDATVGEARRMLIEDHLHSCVGCRRFFEGRGAPAIVMPRRSPALRFAPWAVAAAAAVAAVYFGSAPVLDRILTPSGPRATVATVQGQLYRVSMHGAALLAPGAPIFESDEIRSAPGTRAVIRLRDGSSVEMAERTDLSVTETRRDKTVHLAHGAVMVEAAKQRDGRLEIATPDALVTVKGTIFGVSSGTKGSRVSVVEGEVKVDHDGSTSLLHPGDQKTTSPTISPTSVAQDVAWSAHASKYLALLGEFSEIEKRISRIPGPELRYSSSLAGLLPADTIAFASIPNLASTLAEAENIFEDRVAQSPELREWWNEKETRQVKAIVDEARTFSDYLGNEIILAVPAGHASAPLLVAEVKRPGLRAVLSQKISELNGAVISDTPAAFLADAHGPLVMLHGNTVALAGDRQTLERIAALADAGGHGAFLDTQLWKRVAQTYQSGAGWVFSIDMEQILGKTVPSNMPAGLDNFSFLTLERKQNLGRTEISAALDFSGTRHGLMNWLAAPGPMGTLDFVSPEATFAVSFVILNPAELVQQLGAIGGPGTAAFSTVAEDLGGEVTLALDGPMLPTPAWKVAAEVNDPAAMQAALEQAAASASARISTAQSNGLTYYSLTLPNLSYELDYTYRDGYLLIAPSPALLQSAIATRASGLTLPRSTAFRAQLPEDGHTNFSALLYYNMGSTVAPIIDQLKAGKLITPEQEKSAALLTQNREPGLIYVYGQPGRIVAASRSGFFGLGLDSLLRLNAKGAAALPQLFPASLLHAAQDTHGNATANATRH